MNPDLPPWAYFNHSDLPLLAGWTAVDVSFDHRSKHGWMPSGVSLHVQTHMLGALQHSLPGCRVAKIDIRMQS